MNVTSFQPQFPTSQPDFSNLSGKGGGGPGSGNSQTIDPKALLFASPTQAAVNFGSPTSQTQPLQSANNTQNAANDPNSQNNILQQIVQLLSQLLNMLMNNNPNNAGQQSGGQQSTGQPSNLAVQNGTGSGQGPVNNAASTQPSSATPGQQGTSGTGNAGGIGSLGGDVQLPPALQKYEGAIANAAQASGMPASVIAGMMWAESRGQDTAMTKNVNGGDDAGLMQVNASTFAGLQKDHPELQGKSLSDPDTNILAGALYLSDMNKQFGGDMNAALRAYNSGPGSVDINDPTNTGGIGDPKYTENVMNFANLMASGNADQLPA